MACEGIEAVDLEGVSFDSTISKLNQIPKAANASLNGK